MFNGTCEEAIDFYVKSLGGEKIFVQYYEDAPEEIPGVDKKKVMHASMKFSGGIIMASDSSPKYEVKSGDNVQLSIGIDDAATAEKYFNNLAEGGKVTMPMQETFWAARFGMLTDKFGINWMINCEFKK